MTQHETWMGAAIAEARRGLGRTSPNPPVGAVIVRAGELVGSGFHARAGGDHAEVVALREAGTRALGATLYVTLEPCNHHGRTPPCTDAIIAAGISEVRYGVADPNTAVSGGGRRRLADAGIRVEGGLLEDEATDVCRFWLHRIETGRPYVIAKYAASLDGRIAAATGVSRWITGPPAREAAHRLRAETDAVVIGVGTAIADDPLLTVRTAGYDGPQPFRVVLDSTGRVPDGLRLFGNDPRRTIVATTDRMPGARRATIEACGATVLVLPRAGDGRVRLADLLAALSDRGVVSVLVEGGSEVLGAFFDAGIVDESAVFLAPMLMGGRSAPGAIGGTGAATPSEALRLDAPTTERLGDDWLIRGRIRRNRPVEY